MFYDVARPDTTNAVAQTEDNLLALRTVANQRTAAVVELKLAGRHNSPGGISLRLKRAGTIGSGGAAVTPAPRDPDALAAATTAFDKTFTDGATPVVVLVVGCAAQGGNGWWSAGEDGRYILKPNGGANGNLELHSVAGVSSAPFDSVLTFVEI